MSKVIVMNQDGIEVPVKHSTFSAGEVYVKILEPELVTPNITVLLLSADSEQVMRAIMLADALKHLGAKQLKLVTKYLPYGRQDRVCSPGESFSLNVFLNILSTAGYTSFSTLDMHNHKPFSSWVSNEQVNYKVELSDYYTNGLVVVAPDKGALGRCYLASDNYPVVAMDKVRKLSGISQSIESEDNKQVIKTAKSLLIVDDICDGGATFLSAAKVLRELNQTAKLHLFVTHGIFSQGMEKLEETFDTVRCVNRYSR